MYTNDFSIKEVNAYYARRGGIRTANISNYANAGSFANIMRQTAAQRTAAARESASLNGSAVGQTGQTAGKTTTAQTDSTSATESNGNICCDKCQATNQLLLQMMSRNLYSQSALGYPLTGSASWTAYQNMANLLNSGLYS